MGVILDSSVLIAGERRRDSVWEVLERVEAACGKTNAALSVVTSVELTHGIYRAKTDAAASTVKPTSKNSAGL